ncbi:MAG: envelope integrity protein Cei [Pseudonocardiales bacterium]|nr:envelope integrity protein Cei [Pseudonocardiales bacterium]
MSEPMGPLVRGIGRRRRAPAVLLIVVLAVLGVVTWTIVLMTSSNTSMGVSCNQPANGPAPGEVVAADELAETAPVAAGAVKIRALNAGGQRGRANLVATQLGDLGFTEAAPAANDPVYPDADLDCRGQIRFGPAGAGAARTLSIVLPCTELIRDTRGDDTIDLAVGNAFGEVNPTKPARDLLDQLAGTTDGAPAGTQADPDLLARASLAKSTC